MPRRTRSQNQAQNHQSQASDPPQRLGKEKIAEQTDIDLTQVVSRQAQLEKMVEDTNQTVHTIKQLLEWIAIPPAWSTTRGQLATEGLHVEQQVVKATTRGNATSTCRMNSQQVTRSKDKSTRSAITTRRKHNEAGTSRPQNKTVSGHPTRLEAPMKSRESYRRHPQAVVQYIRLTWSK